MKQHAVRRRAEATLAVIGCLCGSPLAARAHATYKPTSAPAHSRTEREHIDWVGMWASVMEKKLDQWRLTKENERVPRASARSPQTDVVGVWEVHRGYSGSSLSISRSGPDTYDVVFDTHGCTGWWRLLRSARYSGGVLALNRPVEEYCSLPHQRIYAVRVGG